MQLAFSFFDNMKICKFVIVVITIRFAKFLKIKKNVERNLTENNVWNYLLKNWWFDFNTTLMRKKNEKNVLRAKKNIAWSNDDDQMSKKRNSIIKKKIQIIVTNCFISKFVDRRVVMMICFFIEIFRFKHVHFKYQMNFIMHIAFWRIHDRDAKRNLIQSDNDHTHEANEFKKARFIIVLTSAWLETE